MSDSNNVTVTFVIFTAVVIIYIIWYFMCTTFFLFWDQCPSAFGFPPWAHYTPFVIFQTCIVRCHTVVHFYSRRRQNNAVFPSGIPSPGPLIFPGLNTHTTPMSATPQVCHLSWQLTAPLCPEQEAEVAVLLIQEGLRRCHQFWQAAHSALLRSAQRNRRLEDRHIFLYWNSCMNAT